MPIPSFHSHNDLLDRYFAGELDEEQAREVRAYLEKTSARQGVVRGIFDSARGDTLASRPSAKDAYDRFIVRLDHLTSSAVVPGATEFEPTTFHKQGTSPAPVPVSAAAAGPRATMLGSRPRYFIAAAFSVFALMLTPTLWPRVANLFDNSSALLYLTSDGSPATVMLADGSRITLAPYSKITVTRTRETTRHLSLSGEAYFDVVSSAKEPFIVQTGKITTRVLGTAFSVRQYTNEPNVRVVVLNGKVESTNPTSKVTLVAGNVAYLTDSTTLTAQDDARKYTSWTEGRLVFQNTAVRDLLSEVGRWYGYEFQLADSALAARQVTTTLIVKDRAETLRALKELLDVTMTFDGAVVTLEPVRKRLSPDMREKKSVANASSAHKELGK